MAGIDPVQKRQLEDMLAGIKAGEPRLSDEEYRIPIAEYSDADRFAREIALYRSRPLALCHVTQLEKPGSVLALDVVGVPVLITRDKAGELHAFLNVCRHRNTTLVTEEGVCRKSAVVCPYHNWMYGLDGALNNVPMPEAFPSLDVADHGLVPLPAAERHGYLWVVPDPKAELDLAAFLGPLDGGLEALELGGHVFHKQRTETIKANWKMIYDAFFEGYHIQRLHKTSLAPYFLDGHAMIERMGREHLCFSVGRPGLTEEALKANDVMALRDAATFVYYIFPNSLLVFSPDYINHMTLYPKSADETVVVNTMLLETAPENEGESAHFDRAFNLQHDDVFMAEDFHMAERAQAAIRSGANDHLLIGRIEYGVQLFHDAVNEELANLPAEAA